MFFCQNCSKLLDEDLKICPFCGADEEGNVTSPQVAQEPLPAALTPRLEEIDSPKPPPDTQEQRVDLSKHTPEPEAPYLRPPPELIGIEDTISKINEMIENNQDKESAPDYTATAYIEEVLPTRGIKILLILLSIIASPAGLVFGIIYMGKTNGELKRFGKTLLIISIICMVLSVICCCVIGLFSIFSYYGGFYY